MSNTEQKVVELIVNNEQARKKIRELESDLQKAKQAKELALERGDAKAIGAYAKEVKRLQRELQNTETRTASLNRTLGNMDKATPKELRAAIREMKKMLDSGTFERGSEEWDEITEKIRQANSELKQINTDMKEQGGFFSSLKEKANEYVGVLLSLQSASDVLGDAVDFLQSLGQAYADLDQAQAETRKYTGQTADEIKELSATLAEFDTRTSQEQLLALAGDAGKLGITGREDILAFVDAADKINVALGDDLGADAVKNMGKLAQMFGEDERLGLKEAMLSTASAVNEVAQSYGSNANYLQEWLARVAGVGKQAGLSQAQMIGWASVLDRNMQQAETSSTAFSQLLTKFYQEPAKFAELAGLSIAEFTQLLNTDANGALVKFMTTMREKGGFAQLAPMFNQMGLDGTRATGVLTVLADKLDDVTATQRTATSAYVDAVSVQKEFDVQNNTVQAGMEKARKRILELRTEIEERLFPIISSGLSVTNKILRVVAAVSGFVWQNKEAVVAATVSVASFTLALKLNAAMQALVVARTKALALWNASVAVGTRALTGAVGLARVALVGLQWAYAAIRGQTVAATAAQAAFNAAVSGNPYVAVIKLVLTLVAAVGAYVAAMKLFSGENDKANKSLSAQLQLRGAVNEASRKANEAAASEATRIKLLHDVLRSNTAALADKRAALQQLQTIVPGYHATLSAEGKLLNENSGALSTYIEQLKKKALAEALYEKLVDAMRKKADADMAADAWERGLRMRSAKYVDFEKQRAQLNRETQESTRWTAGFAETAAVRRGANGATNPHAEHLKHDQSRLAYWQGEAKSAAAAVDAITAYANKQKINLVGAANSAAAVANSTPSADAVPTASAPSSGGASGRAAKPIDEGANILKEMEEQARQSALVLSMQRANGLLSQREYQHELLSLELDGLQARMALLPEESSERVALAEEYAKKQRELSEQIDAWSLQDIERSHKAQTEALRARAAEGALSQEAMQARLKELDIERLVQRERYLLSVGSEDAAEATAARERAELDEKLERQKDYEARVRALREEYGRKSGEERAKLELAALEELHAKKLVSEEEYEAFAKAIRDKYSKPTKQEEKSALGDMGVSLPEVTNTIVGLSNALDKLREKQKDGMAEWDDYAAVAVGALQVVGASMQSLTSFYQASQDAEQQRVTARYDAEIKRVGENSRRGKILEEQKQKDLAAIKTKYAKRQAAMDLAIALSNTAQAAIVALKSVPWPLNLAAVAATVAAGMLQVATIRKQSEAQQKGYFRGGFTGGSSEFEERGVVHGGEFVATAAAVRNRNVLPMLQILDRAQRSNTVSRLTRADFAPTLQGAEQRSVPEVRVVSVESERTVAAVERLTQKLEEPLPTFVTLEGTNGLYRQLERYKKLKGLR